MKPSVGRIVHFYNPSLPAHANNGVGPGPYAALVAQTGAEYEGKVPHCNLKVFAPFGTDFMQGSVPEKGSKQHYEGGVYWEFPPRVDATPVPPAPVADEPASTAEYFQADT